MAVKVKSSGPRGAKTYEIRWKDGELYDYTDNAADARRIAAKARKEEKAFFKRSNPRKVKLPSKWTNAKVRVDAKGRVQIGLAKNPFLGKGGTLAKGVRSVKAAVKKVARKGNGRTFAVKGERVPMSHEPKAGEVWYLSGRRAVIKRVGTSDGTPYVWFVRPVDGTVAMSTRNLVSGGYLER